MNDQDPYKDLDSAYQEYAFGCNEAESSSWVQPSCWLASVLPGRENSSDNFLSLPELPLQPSISSEELLLLCDGKKGEDCDGKRKAVEEETRNEGIVTGQLICSSDQPADQLRRIRYFEVHNIAEKRRRNLINAKVRTLQELMPHCKKKDKASILEDAAAYIKAMKHQIEMMTTAQRGKCLAPSMSWAGNPGMQFPSQSSFVPVRPGIGMGFGMPFEAGMLCVACTARSAPLIQLPSAGLPCLPSAVASFPFPPMCVTAVEPSAGNYSCDREPCSKPLGTAAAESSYATAASSYSGLEAGRPLMKNEAENAK